MANPRGWATPTGNPAQDELFRAACEAASIPAYVHAPYLINFGSHTEATVEKSVESLRHSLRRAREIGALGVVVHTGSATGGSTARRGAGPGARAHAPAAGRADPRRLPGSAAGVDGSTRASLCSRTWDFGPYFEALDSHPKLGICLDTCHIYAAGHDLTGPSGMRQTLDLLVDTVGAGRLKLIHANDSKDVVGAHKDRHENIGAGHIGAEPFRELFTHPATEGVPLIIETPGGKEGHAADVARLKALRGRRPRP